MSISMCIYLLLKNFQFDAALKFNLFRRLFVLLFDEDYHIEKKNIKDSNISFAFSFLHLHLIFKME